MSEFNIDKFFKKGMNTHTESPPDLVWDNIYNELNTENRRNKTVLYKMMFAASIAFLLGIGFAYLIIDKQDNPVITESTVIEQPVVKEIILANEVPISTEVKQLTNNTRTENSSPVLSNTNKNSIIASHENAVKEAVVLISENENKETIDIIIPDVLSDEDIISDKVVLTNENEQVLPLVPKDNLPLITETLLLEEDNEIELFNTNKSSKWTLGGQITPIYSYRHIISDDQSQIMKDYYNETESGLLAYSGGVNVQYKANGRLSVKTGIYYSKIGQTIQNTYQPTYLKSNVLVDYQSNISIKNSAGVLQISPTEANNSVLYASSDESFSAPPISDIDFFIQSMSFLELPVLLNYKLIDRKIDINLIGGLGANVLVNNQLNFKVDGDISNIGTTEEINKFNYNGTLGIGMEYNLLKNIIFSVEPTFRYYLSSMNQDESINLHPYSFGFFSGLSYSF